MRLMSMLLAVSLVTLFAGAALAHQPPVVDDRPLLLTLITTTVEAVSAAPATMAIDPLALGALALALAALTVVRRLPRRSLAVAVVLCLSILTFESGLHSVHHLGQAAQDAPCVVAAGAAQLHGATPVLIDLDATPLAPAELLMSAEPDRSVSALGRPHQGRAPPALA